MCMEVPRTVAPKCFTEFLDASSYYQEGTTLFDCSSDLLSSLINTITTHALNQLGKH